jgi:hypothetical protein
MRNMTLMIQVPQPTKEQMVAYIKPRGFVIFEPQSKLGETWVGPDRRYFVHWPGEHNPHNYQPHMEGLCERLAEHEGRPAQDIYNEIMAIKPEI